MISFEEALKVHKEKMITSLELANLLFLNLEKMEDAAIDEHLKLIDVSIVPFVVDAARTIDDRYEASSIALSKKILKYYKHVSKWRPTRWHLNHNGHDYGLLTMEQRDGSAKWAVDDNRGCVLNKNGEWEYQPSPSNRDDEFLERCRFASMKDAADAFQAWTSKN